MQWAQWRPGPAHSQRSFSLAVGGPTLTGPAQSQPHRPFAAGGAAAISLFSLICHYCSVALAIVAILAIHLHSAKDEQPWMHHGHGVVLRVILVPARIRAIALLAVAGFGNAAAVAAAAAATDAAKVRV